MADPTESSAANPAPLDDQVIRQLRALTEAVERGPLNPSPPRNGVHKTVELWQALAGLGALALALIVWGARLPSEERVSEMIQNRAPYASDRQSLLDGLRRLEELEKAFRSIEGKAAAAEELKPKIEEMRSSISKTQRDVAVILTRLEAMKKK